MIKFGVEYVFLSIESIKMKAKDFSDLSDDALLKQAKFHKKTKIYDAVIVGFLIGVSIYSIINNGFGILTFLPLVYLPIANRNNKYRAKLKKSVEERGMEW